MPTLHILPLALFFLVFFGLILIPTLIWETIRKWFNSPSKRREKAYFSTHYRYEWR